MIVTKLKVYILFKMMVEGTLFFFSYIKSAGIHFVHRKSIGQICQMELITEFISNV